MAIVSNAKTSNHKTEVLCYKYQCTTCLAVFNYQVEKDEAELPYYCPSCGAKFQAYFKGINEQSTKDPS